MDSCATLNRLETPIPIHPVTHPIPDPKSNLLFACQFNKSAKVVRSKTDNLTSDAGVIPMRLLMVISTLACRLTSVLKDNRSQARITHSLEELVRQLLLQHVQRWGRQSDADKLRRDPAMRVATSSKRGMRALQDDRSLASQPTMSRFVHMLAGKKNFKKLRLFAETFAMEHLLQRGGGKRRPEVVFDVDGVPVDTHGKQQGSKWNEYYKRTIFLPLIAICGESGDMLGAELRGGTQNVVKDCYGFIRHIGLALREHVADKVIVRLDAGFNSGELCDKLENDRIGYVMRLKGNDVIDGLAAPHLEGDQPSDECYHELRYHELRYRAKCWSVERRVVLVVVPVPGELFPRHFYLITDLDVEAYPAEQLVNLYRKRGKAEKHFGELNAACSMALSSVPRPKTHYKGRPVVRVPDESEQDAEIRAENEILLQVYLLTYQLMHVGRCLMREPDESQISLSTYRERVLKVGARFVQHARNIVIHIAASADAASSLMHKGGVGSPPPICLQAPAQTLRHGLSVGCKPIFHDGSTSSGHQPFIQCEVLHGSDL